MASLGSGLRPGKDPSGWQLSVKTSQPALRNNKGERYEDKYDNRKNNFYDGKGDKRYDDKYDYKNRDKYDDRYGNKDRDRYDNKDIGAHGKRKERVGRCCRCHRIFPRRLLTINRYFYKENRI